MSLINYLKIMAMLCIFFTPQAMAYDLRSAELENANIQLNEIYQKILRKMTPSNQIKLRKAQRTWLVFRDLDCAWAFNEVAFDCLIVRTEDRARELKETIFSDAKHSYSTIE